MFKDLKKGYQVYTLDTSGVPKFFMGTVVNVSEPRFAQSQLGQYQQLQDRVMDLTIEVDGKSMTYVVPENQNVAMANGITLACSVDPIMNHLNAMKRTSTDIVNSVDKNKEIIEACDIPKVLDCDQKIVKAVLAYLEDPDAPEGTAFVRYLAVRCFVGDTIKWSEMI